MLAGPVDFDNQVDALGSAPYEVRVEFIIELRGYGIGECPAKYREADVAGDTSRDLGGPDMVGMSGDSPLVEHQQVTGINKLDSMTELCRQLVGRFVGECPVRVLEKTDRFDP